MHRSTALFSAACALLTLACDPSQMGGEPAGAPPLDDRSIDRAEVRFTPVNSGVNVALRGVWAPSPDDLWIVGDDNDLFGGDRASTVLRDTGAGLQVVITDLAPNSPGAEPGGGWHSAQAIGGTSADDLWIVGDSRWDTRPVIHRSAEGWTYPGEPWATYGNFHALWSDGPDAVWLAGNYGDAWLWDGERWRHLEFEWDDNPYFRGAIRGIYAVGREAAWVVGDGTGGSAVSHWDGTRWHVEPTEVRLNAIWGADANDIWAVGQQGRIERFDGREWTAVPSGTAVELHAVRGVAPNAVWAVGDGGTILFWDGETWGPVESGTEVNLYGVFDSRAAVWAVGDEGTVLEHTF